MKSIAEKVKNVVREASKLMLTDNFEIAEKGDIANIVTSSDVAVQEFLCAQLAEVIPGSGFLCEENDVCNTTCEYTWIIDPIDGTCNYARGIDQCAISVGLRHADSMVMGVVYLPRTGEMFHAIKGEGAFRNDKPIHVSDRTFANSVMCTALAVYHKEHARTCSDIIVDAFTQINDIRRFGAAAPELCYLAMGRCELYFEYLLSPWDYAGASVVLTEAGGFISDLDCALPTGITASGILAGNTLENLNHLQAIVAKHLTGSKRVVKG